MVISSQVDKGMMDEDGVTKNAVLFTEGKDFLYVDMGCDNVTITCTQGKLSLWFGRQVGEPLIREILFCISNIDPSVNHEHEVICDFKSISEYEDMSYVLISYAKTKGGYRAIFNIPFSKKKALANFVKFIVDQLKVKDVKRSLHWNGGNDKIILLYNELKKLDGWRIKRIDYKVAGEKGLS